jgi:hypothetical protein
MARSLVENSFQVKQQAGKAKVLCQITSPSPSRMVAA